MSLRCTCCDDVVKDETVRCGCFSGACSVGVPHEASSWVEVPDQRVGPPAHVGARQAFADRCTDDRRSLLNARWPRYGRR